MLQNALDKVETAIEAVVCDPPAGGVRGLLTIYQSSQVSGKWVLSLMGVAGTFGVAFGGLYVPIAHPGPTANFSNTDDVFLIAATTAAGFIYTFALNEIRKKEYTNVIEALILTVVVTTGEVFLALLRSAWKGVCTTSIILAAEVGELFLRCMEQFFVAGDRDNLPAAVQMVPQEDPARTNAVQPNPHRRRQEAPSLQVQYHNICY